MRQFWFKVYCPEQAETRIFWMNLPEENEIEVYDNLKRDVRYVFKLKDDYKFYFIHTDKDNDEIAIKENYEILNYMFRMENNNKLKLTITPVPHPAKEKQQSEESDDASVLSLSESFQVIMKQFELSISSLQATVEKSAVSVAANTVDTVVKTAAETAAHVYRTLLPPTTLSENPQFDVICDGCYAPIRGQRWRCETCEDFDLCSSCKTRVNHPHHNFRYIKNERRTDTQQENIVPQHSQANSCQSNTSRTIFICDYCDSDIVGIRHTCGACPDFDLCHSCFVIVEDNHPNHIFVTRLVGTQASNGKKSPSKQKKTISPRQPYDDKVPIIYHRGVECDNCEATIEGIRYKCGHCANYDLCGTCEEYAASFHDVTHAFIKIKYPIQSITNMPLLPKFAPSAKINSNKDINTSNAPDMEIVNAYNEVSTPEELNSSCLSSPVVVNSPVPPPVVAIPVESMEPQPLLSASFISDINIPDGTLIVPKKTFIKMWKIVNNGNIDWPVGSHLLFNGGNILRPHPISRPDSFVIPVTSPKEEVYITAELQAPDCPGEYSSYFCLCTPEGIRFGDSLWCSIKVDFDEEPEEEKAVNIMMNSSNSMIYPTISTTNETQEQQQEEQKSQSNGDTDNDDYSEITTSPVSPLTSDITHSSYTDSHGSSPSPSELDINESRNNDFSENEIEEECINQVIISPSASAAIPTSDNPAIEEDEFVLVDEQDLFTSQNSSNNNSVSSFHSTATVTSPTTSPTMHDDGFIYGSQLMRLHEMGFTSYDDIAIGLLESYHGRVEDVIATILEFS